MNQPSDHQDAVVEPSTSPDQAVELTRRTLRQRIRQQELLSELGVLALQRTSFTGMLDHTARRRDSMRNTAKSWNSYRLKTVCWFAQVLAGNPE
jgi:hypothetical protein